MKEKQLTDKFRACVGALIINNNGEILSCQREDQEHIWQAPQGGIEIKESPYDAVLREVYEETGIKERCLTLIKEHPDWLTYELPKQLYRIKFGRGQTQKWFLFRFKGSDQDISLHRATSHEFIAYKWLSFQELKPLLSPIKIKVYIKLYEEFKIYIS